MRTESIAGVWVWQVHGLESPRRHVFACQAPVAAERRSVVVTVVQAGSVPEGVGVVTATESALAAQKGFITGDYVPIEVRACSVVAL
jgi:hypothetical protein